MDACKIPAYDGIQGRSLMPIVRNPEDSVRDFVLIEDDIVSVTAKLTPIPARTRSLIFADYRFTRNSKGEEQLFNLSQDPDEMEDLKRSDPIRLEMLEVLSDAMMEADDSSRGAPATEPV